MPIKPQRITFERVKGFDLQGVSKSLNGLPAKMVTRPGKWGNPFVIKEIAARFGLDPAEQPVPGWRLLHGVLTFWK